MARRTAAEAARPAPAAAGADAEPREGRWLRWRSDVLLALVVLLLTVPVLQPLMAQQSARYALTAALWDDRTVAIDRYEHLLGVDHAEREGRLYSDKAPGQPLVGVPAYAAYRTLGGHPATEARWFADPGLWAVTLVSAMLPAALLAVAMRRLALRVAPRRATHAALGLAVGTLLLPFGTVLFGHVLAALLGLVAYLVLTAEPRPVPWRLAAAGALAGAAVTVEYGAVIVAVAVVAAAAWRWRWRAGWVVAGGALPAVLLGAYHTVAFGHPLSTGYAHNVFAEATGLLDTADLEGWSADPAMLVAVLAGERGLFVLTPLVLVGAAGLVALLVDRGPWREQAVVGLAVLAGFLVLMSGWSNPTGGASPGPRYVVPALPFLAGGVAWVWARLPAVAWITAAAGALTMGLATFTQPLVPRTARALSEWWAAAGAGDVAQTWLTEATGSDGAVFVPIALAAAVAAWLLLGEPRGRHAVGAPAAPATRENGQQGAAAPDTG